jgi:hypothetical protein
LTISPETTNSYLDSPVRSIEGELVFFAGSRHGDTVRSLLEFGHSVRPENSRRHFFDGLRLQQFSADVPALARFQQVDALSDFQPHLIRAMFFQGIHQGCDL